MFLKKNRNIECNSQLLFEILSDNLKDELCTDIHFTVDGKKHTFGAYGDSGMTRKNVVFYIDEDEFDSYEELKAVGVVNDKNFYKSNMTVTVTECTGCYPESEPKLKALMKK